MKDWANDEAFYDCFEAVATKFGLTIPQTVSKIQKDYSIQYDLPPRKEKTTKKMRRPINIQTIVKPWEDEQLNYWKRFGISRSTLDKFGVYNVKYVYKNKAMVARATIANPIFVYTFPLVKEVKVYRPLATDKQYKWLGNVKADVLNGYYQLNATGDILIITSSLKDVMCFYELGFPAIAPQGENVKLDEEVVKDLKKRFSNVIVWYDSDAPGNSAARKLSRSIGCPYTFIPLRYGAKDISEFRERYGARRTRKLVKRQVTNVISDRLWKDIPFA